MKKGVFCLKDLPRVMNRTPRIWEIGWMPDHLYLHRNRRIEAPHLCFTLRAELGAVKTLVNGRLRERRIRAPYVGLVRHGQVYHTVQAVRHDELYFVYEPAMYGELLSMMPSAPHFELTCGVQNVISEILSNLEHLNVPGTADRLDLLAVRLLLETRIAQFECGGFSFAHPRIGEVASYLSTHFMYEIRVEELIRQFGFSKRSFYRYWQQYSELSPVQFLQEKRLQYARSLLENTGMAVCEVAQVSRFRSTAYFTQCFSRHFGCSPSKCRSMVKLNFRGTLPTRTGAPAAGGLEMP